MCGICGYVTKAPLGDISVIQAMNAAIIHRGPDDSGISYNPNEGIVLGHRRLAIVDLTPSGHQPMSSSSKRFEIVFNGEIYNYKELRYQLNNVKFENSSWHGCSDTEVLLACIDQWGITTALDKSIGMFAFALWDKKEKDLFLVRDRMGEKPLYYGWQNNVFLFGSELKSLKAHPAFEGNIDRQSIAMQLNRSCIPAPYSIYEGIRKLPPGTYLKLNISKDNLVVGELPTPIPYWSLNDVINKGHSNLSYTSDADTIFSLDSLLRDSVKQQMKADVPLGAFLSGGVDSSLITALMQLQSRHPVQSFSIGFNEKSFNEAVYAKAVARHIGTVHTEIYITPQQVIDSISLLPSLYDEPFSDSSQIPTYLLSQITRKHVTVSLSGDAADELFGGYNRYIITEYLWNKISNIPFKLRHWIAYALSSISPDRWNMVLRRLGFLIPKKLSSTNLGDKIHKGARVLNCDSLDNLYLGLVSHWDARTIMIGDIKPYPEFNAISESLSTVDGFERLMALDALSYLPNDILVKVDRAAMGVSLETRMPFLDHRVIEFSWNLPKSMKIRKNQSKWILRQVLYQYVPRELIDRPKMGFSLPIDSWLRGPLRDWGESLIDESRLRAEGFFKTKPIRKKWDEHLSGRRNWRYHLWNLLMFQAWLEKEKQ